MVEMTAVAWHGRGDVRVGPWRINDHPPDGWVRIRVAWCGICGSDTAEFVRGPVVIPTRPHPLSGRQAPLVLGHEISGTATTVGADVTVVSEGDRLVTDALIGCASCTYCLSGQMNLCHRLAAVGLSADGGLADYVDVPAASCQRLPDHLPPDVAALAEPLAVAVRAVKRARLHHGAAAVVLGGGAVGLLIAMILAKGPVGSIVVVEPATRRGDLVRRLAGVPVVRSLDELPAASGTAQVAFECTGNHTALNDLIVAVSPQSRIVLVGVHGRDTPTDLHAVLHGEIELLGSLSHDQADFRAAVAALGEDPERYATLITHQIGWDQVPAALRSLADPDATAGKILAGPRGDRWTAS